MNKDQIKGSWKETKGALRKKWGKLTDDEIEQAKGDRENLIGTIQKKYGETKESIQKSLDKIWH